MPFSKETEVNIKRAWGVWVSPRQPYFKALDQIYDKDGNPEQLQLTTVFASTAAKNSEPFFQFTPEGMVTTLHIFRPNIFEKDGISPQPYLIQEGDSRVPQISTT
ncbi:MAG: hypothetical protein WC661_11595 [Opitutaceae bacterium]